MSLTRRACRDGLRMAHPVTVCDDNSSVARRINVRNAVCIMPYLRPLGMR